ncbi:MAG: radical SAM protein [Nanoarchaeota archaeon]|nr:radical SAM protein [Nanoarchaeota archaeon]
MRIAKEIFVKPLEDDRFVIYSPLLRKVSVVNQGFLSVLKQASNLDDIPPEQLKLFQDAGVIVREEDIPRPQFEPFNPTTATIFTTSDCNLRCVYCYGNAGEEKKTISLDVALASVDLVVKNALKLKVPRIGVSFHGEGEPTFAWDIFTKTIEYVREEARKNGLKARINLSSNGVYSQEKLDWIVNNVDVIGLSIDGPKDIQDKQRPLYKSSASSYEAVMATVERFHQENFDFLPRATITKESAGRLDELVRFFALEVRAKKVHFEPVYVTGRCLITNSRSPKPKEFSENYFKALDLAKELGIEVRTSLLNLDGIKNSFCGATGRNFGLTPEGYISSCFEVTSKSDSRSDVFFYGKYNPETGAFDIDEKQREFLFSRTVENMKACQDCFVKWSCAGDCLAKASSEGDLFAQNEYSRCETRRLLAHKAIEREMKKYGG